MSHFPVDHPLRGLYRGLALLSGVALTVYGVVGYVQTSELDFFAQDGERVLGLTTNPAFALASVVSGVVAVLATLIGRNVDVPVYLALGGLFMVGGLLMLCVIRTDANYLASSITNVNVSSVIGLIFMSAGLYGTSSRQRTKVAAPGSSRARDTADASA